MNKNRVYSHVFRLVYDKFLWDEEIVDSISKKLSVDEIEFFKKQILRNHIWHIDPVDVVYEGTLEVINESR